MPYLLARPSITRHVHVVFADVDKGLAFEVGDVDASVG